MSSEESIAKSEGAGFGEIASLIQKRRQKVTRLINTELIELYWDLGQLIYKRIEQDGWGRSTVKDLADYLTRHAPNMKGFSSSNLWRMRQFYETWKDAPEKLVTLSRELSWSSNVDLLGRCKLDEERQFYLAYAVREGLSVRQLREEINKATFERFALSDQKLVTPSRELTTELKGHFKDSYILDFLEIPDKHSEQDLRRSLVSMLGAFLRELGRDFTFIGEEYPIQVGTRDGFIDLLFFHRELNCLIAIELKITDFEPSHLGQLNFYLEALDRDVRKPHENPSIGLLLCASKDDEVVEYALSRSLSPALVAEYQTKLPDKKLLQAKLHEFLELSESAKAIQSDENSI